MQLHERKLCTGGHGLQTCLSFLESSCRSSFKPGNFEEILSSQLHHFADASQVEFRAVAHVRFENADELVHATFFWQNLV